MYKYVILFLFISFYLFMLEPLLQIHTARPSKPASVPTMSRMVAIGETNLAPIGLRFLHFPAPHPPGGLKSK